MEAPPLQERGPNNIHGQLPNQRKPSNVVEGIVPSPSQAAISATTLGADNFIKVSAPSMISTTKTVPLSQHEELIFPPRPLGRIRKRYQKMKKCRLASHIYLPKDYSSLSYSVKQPGAESLGMMAKEQYPDRLNYAPPTGEMIQRDFESDWDECIKVVGEITCPFCFFALPALDVTHKDKWMCVSLICKLSLPFNSSANGQLQKPREE
jgi:hypothetical protein